MAAEKIKKRMKQAPKRVVEGFARFDAMESSGAIIMFFAAVIAIILANTNLYGRMHEFLGHVTTIGSGKFAVVLSPELFVNDVLMALFFLTVGIEIKREILVGELAEKKKAILPAIAALGGIIVPACIYLVTNVLPGVDYPHGWGVPVATDIAFALGVLSFLSNRIPSSLKVFLTALAIVDDLGAIIVIAVFYSSKVSIMWLLIGAGIVAVMFLLNRLNVASVTAYMILGVLLLYCCLMAGIHPTIAGVITAFMLPSSVQRTRGRPSDTELEESPLIRAERRFLGPATYIVLPLFALANAGVRLVGIDVSTILDNHATWGVLFGLVIGKPLGIVSASAIAVKAKLSELPGGVTWRTLLGAGMVAGIGFTMSIFVANLAFPDHPEVTNAVKVSILMASLIAGVFGFLYLRVVTRNQKFSEDSRE